MNCFKVLHSVGSRKYFSVEKDILPIFEKNNPDIVDNIEYEKIIKEIEKIMTTNTDIFHQSSNKTFSLKKLDSEVPESKSKTSEKKTNKKKKNSKPRNTIT